MGKENHKGHSAEGVQSGKGWGRRQDAGPAGLPPGVATSSGPAGSLPGGISSTDSPLKEGKSASIQGLRDLLPGPVVDELARQIDHQPVPGWTRTPNGTYLLTLYRWDVAALPGDDDKESRAFWTVHPPWPIKREGYAASGYAPDFDAAKRQALLYLCNQFDLGGTDTSLKDLFDRLLGGGRNGSDTVGNQRNEDAGLLVQPAFHPGDPLTEVGLGILHDPLLDLHVADHGDEKIQLCQNVGFGGHDASTAFVDPQSYTAPISPSTLAQFDVAAAWKWLDESQRRQIGTAAIVHGLGALRVVRSVAGLDAREAAAGVGWAAAEQSGGDALVGCIYDALGGEKIARLHLPDLKVIGVQACRVCGCTEACGCPEGCWWVAPGLCSSCAPALVEAAVDLPPALRTFIERDHGTAPDEDPTLNACLKARLVGVYSGRNGMSAWFATDYAKLLRAASRAAQEVEAHD